MAHAKPQDLKDIDFLLVEFRKLPQLKEKSFGCFYAKSKGVLHFHVKGERRYAHAFDGKEWVEIDIKPQASLVAQKKHLKEIKGLLALNEK